MIEPLPDLPDGVLGFRFSGAISRDEYVDVLLPAMTEALDLGHRIRLLLVIEDDFGWFEPGAFWEDLKFGVGSGTVHRRVWERTAVVSDAGWVRPAMAAFGWMVPGTARLFTQAEVGPAKDWLSGTGGPPPPAGIAG
jgi:hypothetical protein